MSIVSSADSSKRRTAYPTCESEFRQPIAAPISSPSGILKTHSVSASFDKKVEKEGIDSELEAYILKKIEERKEAKKNKDFATADAIRDELAAKGIVLKDTREGTTYTVG